MDASLRSIEEFRKFLVGGISSSGMKFEMLCISETQTSVEAKLIKFVYRFSGDIETGELRSFCIIRKLFVIHTSQAETQKLAYLKQKDVIISIVN
ncbi:hypothetical protein JTB14_010765 [Gonioctena quinquepunctata]|nr:hypothetical protein JTB14_010765 [Gonioctena quinquepunctata]